MARWAILGSPEFLAWYQTSLTDDERDAIVATAIRLQMDGPALRRPLSGIIKGSRFSNMKELIPPAGNIRILYIFDPQRRAILLLGGDKTNNWADWYKASIPVAEGIYERHLAAANVAPRRSERMGRGCKR